MNFEIVRPNVLAGNAGGASQDDVNIYCPDNNGNCPGEMNVTCDCNSNCGNYNCGFVAVGEGCQEVSVNCLNP